MRARPTSRRWGKVICAERRPRREGGGSSVVVVESELARGEPGMGKD